MSGLYRTYRALAALGTIAGEGVIIAASPRDARQSELNGIGQFGLASE